MLTLVKTADWLMIFRFLVVPKMQGPTLFVLLLQLPLSLPNLIRFDQAGKDYLEDPCQGKHGCNASATSTLGVSENEIPPLSFKWVR